MKKGLTIITITICLLILGTLCYQYYSVFDFLKHRSGYVGNINNPNTSYQLVYKPNVLRSVFEEEYKFVLTNGADTTVLDIALDSIQKEALVLIDSQFKDGALYELQIPLKGFSATLSDEHCLEDLYSQVSDYVYIPNSLYTLSLLPIELKNNFKKTYNGFKGVPKRLFYVWYWYYRRYAYPYVECLSDIQTNQKLENWGANCILYSDCHYPEIELLYRPDGFSIETSHITQYPVILLSYDTEEKSLLVENNGKTLWGQKNNFVFNKPYNLIHYDVGYLLCVKGDSHVCIPSKEILDTLIANSNSLIKSSKYMTKNQTH